MILNSSIMDQINKSLKYGCTLFCLFLYSFANAQNIAPSVINSTGNTLSNSNWHFDYSIGELVVSTISNTSNSITQGVLQPYASQVSSISEYEESGISIYPNPVNSDVFFTFEKQESDLDVEIFNAIGIKVYEAKVTEKTLDLSGLEPGIYLMKVLNLITNREKIFNFIKTP